MTKTECPGLMEAPTSCGVCSRRMSHNKAYGMAMTLTAKTIPATNQASRECCM